MTVNRLNQKGFTMVEFLIATAVFSMVLLLCSVAVVQVGRTYFKGIINARIQESSRRIIDEVASSIQFGPSADTVPGFASRSADQTDGNGITSAAYCIGGVRFSFVTNAAQGDTSGTVDGKLYSRHVMWRDRYVGSCVPANMTLNTPSAGGVEMLAENMRIQSFSIGIPTQLTLSWPINIKVAYGDDPQVFIDDNPQNICKSSVIVGNFCATSEFNTSVYKRL